MKQSVTLATLSLMLVVPAARAQSPPAPASPPAAAPASGTIPGVSKAALEADPTIETLKKLKPEEIETVKKNVNEASGFVGGIRLLEALQRLGEAEALAPDLFMIHNLKGAVFTKMRLFDHARKSFERAAELNPASFHPRFNLAEIEFVEAAAMSRGKDPAAAAAWAKAQHAFEDLLKKVPDEGSKKLVQFKLTICLLLQDKSEQADALLKTFSYLDDEPIYYLGHAARGFQNGDKPDAQSWIDSANRIYPQHLIAVYLDSFIEVGWVESLAL